MGPDRKHLPRQRREEGTELVLEMLHPGLGGLLHAGVGAHDDPSPCHSMPVSCFASAVAPQASFFIGAEGPGSGSGLGVCFSHLSTGTTAFLPIIPIAGPPTEQTDPWRATSG